MSIFTLSQLGFFCFDVNGAIRWIFSGRASGNNYDMLIYKQGSSPSLSSISGSYPVLTLAQSGNIGMNVQSPDYHLDIMSDNQTLTNILSKQNTVRNHDRFYADEAVDHPVMRALFVSAIAYTATSDIETAVFCTLIFFVFLH